MPTANQDDLECCCEKDVGDGAAHSYPFLQLMPTAGDFLVCAADVKVLEVVAYQALDVGWNIEEVKCEGCQLVGNRPVGICKVQPDYVEI